MEETDRDISTAATEPTGAGSGTATTDGDAPGVIDDGYKWIALANTTAATFMALLDGSIVIIAMPAIFRSIHLDPLAPANITYLLWMILGYRLVQAVFVVTVGRLGTCTAGCASTTPALRSSPQLPSCCPWTPTSAPRRPCG